MRSGFPQCITGRCEPYPCAIADFLVGAAALTGLPNIGGYDIKDGSFTFREHSAELLWQHR
ncbi:hypothetical protein Brsp01_53820 [Brucella sp. NBRC 12950]|nr:hypothetical protein Brsp01_53820 [Brucella sp. NBRC 12950]